MVSFLILFLLSPAVTSFSAIQSQNSRRRQRKASIAPLFLSESWSDSSPYASSAGSSGSSSSSTTSIDFSIDPTSPEALRIVRDRLGLSLEQHQKLAALAVLLVDWNTRINLVSRRDCTKEVVFGRHILPSLAPCGLSGNDAVFPLSDGDYSYTSSSSSSLPKFKVIDVGTGGGFPGLPLAIAYPQCDFLLVDSVGKKLFAVQDMADRLGLTNVQTHNGRAEVLTSATSTQQRYGPPFDLCVGRSVAAIPTYCFWIQKLLKQDTGKLLYMIGGEIEDSLLEQADLDKDIDDLLKCPGASDKRILVFPQRAVQRIAAASGEKIRVPMVDPNSTSSSTSRPKRNPNSSNNAAPKSKRAKGEWSRRRDATTPKQRGYSNFQRFDSLNSPSSSTE